MADSCPICFRQAERPAEYLALGDHFVVRHSAETRILGYLVLESRRHILDYGEMSQAESDALGSRLRALVQAIRTVTGCARVYSFALAEAVPHLHVHLIPRGDSLPRAFRGRGVLAYPLEPACDPNLASSVFARIKRELKRCL